MCEECDLVSIDNRLVERANRTGATAQYLRIYADPPSSGIDSAAWCYPRRDQEKGLYLPVRKVIWFLSTKHGMARHACESCVMAAAGETIEAISSGWSVGSHIAVSRQPGGAHAAAIGSALTCLI